MTSAVLSGGGKLWNRTGDIVQGWKERYSTTSVKEAVFEDLRKASIVSLADISEVFKKFLRGKEPGVDKIHPELQSAWHYWLTCLLSVAWSSGPVPLKWQTDVVVERVWSVFMCPASPASDLQNTLGQFAAECEAVRMWNSTSKSDTEVHCTGDWSSTFTLDMSCQQWPKE